MRRKEQLIDHGLIKLFLFALVMLTPFTSWAQTLTVGGIGPNEQGNFIDPTNEQTIAGVTFDSEANKLTLSNGASVGQIIYSGTSDLTIAFSGTCSITTEDNYAIQYGGAGSERPQLTFSLTNESTTGALNISGSNSAIEGFSDVDFGNLNLASRSAQGVYYDKSNNLMSGNGGNPSDLKITTETYYPIWIHDSSISSTGYSHTQLSEGATSVAVGGGTVSFDGNHTITISNVAFNYEDNNMIVVGPSMTELTVKLDGTSSARDRSTVLGLWKSTPLTFTTNASTPGSLTGYGIVSWNGDGNGQITYQNGLKVFYDVDVPGKEIISTTGTYIKIGDTPITGTTTTVEGYEGVSFDASTNTLTLNNATITVNDKDAIVSQLDNLTVFLVGDQNTITCQGGDDCAFKGTGSKTVTFATNSSEAGSLKVQVNNEAQLYSNITPIYSGLSIKNEGYTYTISSDSYDLWIGDTRVTDANKGHILGEGNETVTFSVTGTAAVINTLTLKGATLTVPIKVGLSNLTIDIQGTNTITTSETCIQKIDNTNPSVTFNSTSDEVGSLSLKGSSGVYGVGYGTFTISEKFAVIMKYYDRYYSYQYHFTDGSTTEALLTPSYGITVGDMQIGEGNAADVTGYGIGDGSVTASGMVSFNKATNTLTLNKASIGVGYITDYPITSSLPNLNIKLIGDNTATVDNQNPYFVRYDGTENTPQLTFLPSDREVTENDGVLSVSFGKLTVNGIAEIGSLASGYTFAEDIQGEINTSYTGNSSWSATVNSSTLTLSYVEAYDVRYGNNRVISTNLMAGVSGAPYFNPETNTILLNADFNSGPINSRLDELTVQVNGVVSLNSASASPAIQYTGEGGGKLKFTCVSETTPTSLTLNANNTGAAAEYKAIEGFSSDNITFTAPMKLASPSSSELLTAQTVTVANYETYGLTVAGTEVTSLNKDNVLKGDATNDGKVSYNDGILTLNGASIGSILCNHALTIHLLGLNIIDAQNEGAIYYTGNDLDIPLNFTTVESAPGQLLITNASLEGGVISGFVVNYANGLGYTWEGTAFAIATLPTMSPEGGVYWTDQKFTISGNTGATLGYTDGVDTYTAYTAPFTLNVGSQTLYPYSLVTDETNTVHVRPAEGQIYYIYDKPGFSVAAGTYDEAQNITLTNLPATLPEGADVYPQVWYFLGDDDNDDSNDIRITSATQTIEVNESTKVSVYILDGDSSKKKKSEVVEAEYVIRQNPGLQYMQGENPIEEVVDWTMGGTNNPALPTLKNTNEVAVTYESSAPAVATVATDGTVTPVGVGTTTITASSAQTDVYTAGTASYTLNVYKDLSHSSITVEVAEATYNGAPLEPAVTVKDGETSIAEFVSVEYANNTNAALSTAETAPTVTVTATTGAEVNYYKGSAQKTFTITAMSLETVLINDIVDQTYTGEAITPTLLVTEGDKILILDTDYTVTYTDNVNAGTATATITGMGNYQGTKSKTFTITAKSLATGYTVSVDATQTYTYTGSAITPGVTVAPVGGGDALVLDTDYTVSYSNNVNAAKADDATAPTVTVTGKGNYTGTASAKFTIEKATPTITTAPTAKDLTYTGEAQALVDAGTVSAGTLVYSTTIDGTFSETIPTGTNADTYTVYYMVNGNDNYNGIDASETNKVSVAIKKATITEVTLENPSLTYTGEEQTATIASVKAGNLTLTADDYEVSGNTGTAKGTYTVTVTAKETSNFTGSKTAEFTIGVKAVTAEMIASIADQTYTGTAITPTLTVTDDETTLTLDTDYTVAYTDNINVGTATATITGKGNYGSTASKTFTISAKALTAAMIADIANQTYTGSAITPTLTVTDGDKTLTLDTDYEVSYTNNINVASASDNLAPTVTVTGKGNYKGTASTTFTISAKTVTAAMIADIADQTYSGAAITPTLTVTDDGKTLALNTDYEVAYTDNVNAGTATATITGKGNYGSTASKTFTISPKELTADMVTLSPESFEYNGATQKPEVTVADGTALTANDYTIENNGGVEVGKYDVVVTAKGNYTGKVTKQFEIVNRKLKAADVTFSENWASFYHPTENIDLPEGVAAYVLTAVGETTATATQISYIPAGVAVLLQNEVTTTTTNTSAEGNLMVHADEAVDVTTVGGTVYGLYNGKLMRVASGTIPAGKNYLRVNQTSGAPQLTITVDNTTAIEMLENAAAIENGTDEWFTLDGRKLQQKPTKKGLYIKNGKVVVNNK